MSQSLRSATYSPLPIFFMIIAFISLGLLFPWAPNAAQGQWQLVLSADLQQDKAIQVAVADLKETGQEFGITFTIASDESAALQGDTILVGGTSRNQLVKQLTSTNKLKLQTVENPQGYEIVTQNIDGHTVMAVSGGSVLGDVYGLYWLWDRIRVYKELPEINTLRIPRLETRINLAWGRGSWGGGSEEQMNNALRYSINWVAGPPVLDLVPWDSEPEHTTNVKNREDAKKFIEYAHALHLKYYSFANEFTYHPSLLKQFNATLSPCDERFWDALQEKFRMLFTAMPELDGIELCNDDISGFWDNYRPFDVMHDGEGCEWPLDKRYRTFVKKIHEVVVGEFDKTYLHFTWSLVQYEQHYQADVFRKIFTDDVPVKNLYLIPKVTAADRWWHQPYNPTFNQTKHNTMVGFETMNYYEGGSSNIFPTFAGQYYQAGLQTFLSPENNNVKGAGFLVGWGKGQWSTPGAYSYVLYRLSWDPDEDIRQIAEDYCSIHFGHKAAKAMADILLLSPVAYKYGLHIEPVSYGTFNSFIHMRVGTFPAEGYPSIDGGREHMEFLRKIYLRCKPWIAETLDDLDHGLATAKEMNVQFKMADALIEDRALAEKTKNELAMTQLLLETNNRYVRTSFAYFQYRERPNAETRQALLENYDGLLDVKKRFTSAPGFGYRLFGIDQLLKNAKQALDDLEKAETILANAPSRDEIEETLVQQQIRYADALEKNRERAKKFMQVDVMVDGRDILIIQGDKLKIEHLRWDHAHVRQSEFLEPLPPKAVTVIPACIDTRPVHPFVLEQPSAENDYTVKVYLYDKPAGHGLMRFDLYYIPDSPESLGVALPWEE